MWPFTTSANHGLHFRRIHADFAISGQIAPADVVKVAEAGFKTIVCARPDNEEMGQPSFAAIASAARRAGIEAVYIPVSGAIGEGQLIRMEDVLRTRPGPVFGYCRSGARAGSLFSAANAALR
ncbi:MAG TPA: TIGR01244 family sulfur transferase [Devosia sp.]|nr:TIGR01244 family sulfur transferase [Devosia sp.]